MNLLKRIIYLGIHDDVPRYKQSVIRISNRIALLMSILGLGYTVFSFFLNISLAIAASIMFFASVIVLVMNAFRFTNLSRIVLAFGISFSYALYHTLLIQPGEEVILGNFLGQFVISILPWVYIDIRERGLLTLALVITTTLFIAQPFFGQMAHAEVSSEIFRSGIFATFTYIFVILGLWVCFYLLQNKNLHAEEANNQLLEDINTQNKDLETQQTKLKETLEEVNEARKEDEKRSWVNQGMSEVAELLRSDDNKDLFSRLISKIVKYVGLNQGGIYLLEEENEEEFLVLKSCYAFDRQKFINKKIPYGNGLLSQACKEKESIYMVDVPENYITITSGLGDANPRNILIVPLIQEDVVLGALEVASFEKLEDFEKVFLEQICIRIAAFIESHKRNEKARQLLEQTQQQAEELRAQEEEMRQNMEELQATQEELQRKEREYIVRIEELERIAGQET